MHDGVIYAQQGDGPLVEMRRQGYVTEADLQGLLARYPKLIPGDQVDTLTPRQWLLVRREAGIPDGEGAGDRWSLDHLFLDQDGVPTLIEVKRSSDPRARREVVAQMLDYAANSVVFSSVERMQAWLELATSSTDRTPDEAVIQDLGVEDVEAFWSNVDRNLRAGRIRMIFVADVIAPELRQIVEFLNKQMNPAEVFAVEVQQYVGEGLRTLVPRLIGQTAEAERLKRSSTSSPRREWDAEQFRDALEPTLHPVFSALVEWVERQEMGVRWGTGTRGRMGIYVPLTSGEKSVFSFWTNGRGELPFGDLAKLPPFDDEQERDGLRNQLYTIPGMFLSTGGVNGWPTFDASVLLPPEGWAAFDAIITSAVDRILAEAAA